MQTWTKAALIAVGVFIAGGIYNASNSPKGQGIGPPQYPLPGEGGVGLVDSTILSRSEKLIAECVRERVLGKILYSNITKAVARPLFSTLEYDQKRGVAVALSTRAKAYGYDGHVKFLDPYDNRELGMFNALTGHLDWKRE